MNENDLLVDVRGPIATITFNRPGARNAMTWQMYEGLVNACDRIDSDDAVRVAVLRGAGDRAFVAGTDITQFLDFSTAEDGLAYERRTDRVFDRLERLRVPTIAAVRGYAVGGGLGLAAACDMRICTPESKFGLPIARTLGNCVSMRTYARLSDLVGRGRALHLIYTAGFMPAADALTAGLVTEVVAQEDFDSRLHELCDQLSGHAPLTMWASKEEARRLRESRMPDGDDIIEACYGSEDFREGARAFVEKRSPRWRGR
ncbi:MAG: enoyl-CoA hydratase/isomerase family protein [Nocardiopsaceae bacterium]|nr:enoyl-CoA hydratase/isomerase family protein [Nocardiopsaceae bacterium]